jgi:hypothetical protein
VRNEVGITGLPGRSFVYQYYLSAGLSNGGHNGGVGVEEVISGHARLAWHTSGHNNNFCSLQAGLENRSI